MTCKASEKDTALSDQESRLIELIRDTKYGELHILFQRESPYGWKKSKKA